MMATEQPRHARKYREVSLWWTYLGCVIGGIIGLGILSAVI